MSFNYFPRRNYSELNYGIYIILFENDCMYWRFVNETFSNLSSYFILYLHTLFIFFDLEHDLFCSIQSGQLAPKKKTYHLHVGQKPKNLLETKIILYMENQILIDVKLEYFRSFLHGWAEGRFMSGDYEILEIMSGDVQCTEAGLWAFKIMSSRLF